MADDILTGPPRPTPELDTGLARWREVLSAMARGDALGFLRRLCPEPMPATAFFLRLSEERRALASALAAQTLPAERTARMATELEAFFAAVAACACAHSQPGPGGEPLVSPRRAGTGPLPAPPHALALLRDTSRRLLGQLDLRHLLPVLVERAAAVGQGAAGFLAVWDEAAGGLELVESRGLAPLAGRRLSPSRADLLARLPEDQARWCDAVSLPWLAELRVERALVAPLVYRGELLGVLGCADPRAEDTDAASELLALLAGQTTIALRNAAHYREIVQKAAALRDANMQLQGLDRLKDQFLGTISHELRTPLNFITGFGSVLIEEADELKSEHRRYLETMLDGAYQLLALVDDLLDFSRVRAGRLNFRFEPCSVDALLAETVERFRVQAGPKGIALALSLEAGVPEVVCDRQRVGQVLSNLVSNALKFTPEGGRIAIEARLSGEALRVAVADTGPGIRPEHLPLLFERFSQLDTDLTRQVGGTGLGLAISKSLTEAHGGTIGVASPVPPGEAGEAGVGTLFWFTLPLAGPAE